MKFSQLREAVTFKHLTSSQVEKLTQAAREVVTKWGYQVKMKDDRPYGFKFESKTFSLTSHVSVKVVGDYVHLPKLEQKSVAVKIKIDATFLDSDGNEYCTFPIGEKAWSPGFARMGAESLPEILTQKLNQVTSFFRADDSLLARIKTLLEHDDPKNKNYHLAAFLPKKQITQRLVDLVGALKTSGQNISSRIIGFVVSRFQTRKEIPFVTQLLQHYATREEQVRFLQDAIRHSDDKERMLWILELAKKFNCLTPVLNATRLNDQERNMIMLMLADNDEDAVDLPETDE